MHQVLRKEDRRMVPYWASCSSLLSNRSELKLIVPLMLLLGSSFGMLCWGVPTHPKQRIFQKVIKNLGNIKFFFNLSYLSKNIIPAEKEYSLNDNNN
jgi:hypothetical protein